MWGVAITSSRFGSADPPGGSWANTSKTAPLNCPWSRASATAASSTRPPRAALTRTAPFGSRAISRAPIMPFVSGVSGTWRVRICERGRRSSSESGSTSKSRILSSERSGSWPMHLISKATARCATARPICPNPKIPIVLPRSSRPLKRDLSHSPRLSELSAAGIWRKRPSRSPNVSSATAMAFAPGTLSTPTPRSRAAAASMLSMPAPARATQRSFGAASIRRRVTLVAPRTTQASMSPTSGRSSDSESPRRSSTEIPGVSRRIETARLESGSLTRTLADTRGGGGLRLAEGFLSGLDTGARLDRSAVVDERQLERADEAQDVPLVVVADVAEAEDLPLQAILTARDLDAVAMLHRLQDGARLDALRHLDRGERVRGDLREKGKPQRPHRLPRGVGIPLVPREHLVAALLREQEHRRPRGEHQADR